MFAVAQDHFICILLGQLFFQMLLISKQFIKFQNNFQRYQLFISLRFNPDKLDCIKLQSIIHIKQLLFTMCAILFLLNETEILLNSLAVYLFNQLVILVAYVIFVDWYRETVNNLSIILVYLINDFSFRMYISFYQEACQAFFICYQVVSGLQLSL